MADKFQIKINSILGGHSPTTHFAAEDQYRASLGINPSLSISGANSQPVTALASSGLIRPATWDTITPGDGSTMVFPYWIAGSRSTTTMYIYATGGGQNSIYTYVGASLTALSDGGSMANGSGNGFAYYDNYIYAAKNTTIARYGPLDGTPVFDGNYWAGTLGKTALTSIRYPSHYYNKSSSVPIPNHFMHRHSDGKLYIADVVDNKGTIHYISTTKTTAEGDTDNGSTYSKLTVGYGLVPVAMESYGDFLVIAFNERDATAGGTSANTSYPQLRAKIAFWDTTSQNINQITWVEYPDTFITAMKNVNGVLHFFSAQTVGSYGFRVMKYIGGNSFEEVVYSEFGSSPWPGAVDGVSNQLFFATFTEVPEEASCVYAVGLNKKLSSGLFNIAAERGEDYGAFSLIAMKYTGTTSDLHREKIMVGLRNTANGGYLGITPETSGTTKNSTWWSQLYKIGQPFKITKIIIPLAQAMAANMIITPTIYVDDGAVSYVGGTDAGVPVINNTNYASKRHVTFRPQNLTGEHNFWIELRWTGSALCVVSLPITIEYELTLRLNMDPHEQFNLPPLPDIPETPSPGEDFYSVGNIIRTDKSFNVKNRFMVTDSEIISLLGMRLKRFGFSTLITGSVYTAAANDYIIGITSLSYAPSVGLPSPKRFGPGKTYFVKDEVGGAATTTITIRSEAEENIDGAASTTITTNYGTKEFYTDGANWFTK